MGNLSSQLGCWSVGQLWQSLISLQGHECTRVAVRRRTQGKAMGFCKALLQQAGLLGGPTKPEDKVAGRRPCSFVQMQHTPKLKPGRAHKSFCKVVCPTSRCASSPSYTLLPSQASPQTHLHSLGTSSQTRPRGAMGPLRASTPTSAAGKQPSAITCSHRCPRLSSSLGFCRRASEPPPKQHSYS